MYFLLEPGFISKALALDRSPVLDKSTAPIAKQFLNSSTSKVLGLFMSSAWARPLHCST